MQLIVGFAWNRLLVTMLHPASFKDSLQLSISLLRFSVLKNAIGFGPGGGLLSGDVTVYIQ